MAILDVNGQPFEQRTLTEEPQTASLVHLQRTVAEHPAKGITPARLNEILQAAEQGDLTAQHELFEDMEERDGHVFSELSKRKRAVVGLDWEVVAPRNANAEEEKLAEYAADLLADMGDLEDVFMDALDAISHAFSPIELQWRRLGKDWTIQGFHHRPQAWFEMDRDTRTELRLRDSSLDGQPLKTFGWMVHIHRAKSGYLARSGLGRVLVWPYLFKHFSVGDLAEFLDIYGLPLRLGKYPSNATNVEKAALWKAVAGMGHAAAGIMPQSMAVEFAQAAQGSEKPFETMMRWCEQTQTKAITGNLATTERGNGGGMGSGLADLANEVRKEIIRSDAKQLAATITQQLIYPLLAINKGVADMRRCPRFEFDVTEPEDIKVYADSLPKLVGVGMRIPIDWAHDKLRIPQGSDKDPVLTAFTAVKPAPDKADKNAALTAALKAKTAATGFEDQDALDAALNTLATTLQPDVAKWLKPAIDALRQCESAEAALELLAADNPNLDDADLIEAMARAMFVCELLGVDAVQAELED